MSATTLSPASEIADSGKAKSEDNKLKRILLVEGDGFTRLVLILRLRLAGFGVDFTSNGILGRGKLRSCHPDILLVELKLCGLSGLELMKAARADSSFGDRPIYVYTHTDRMSRSTRKEVAQLATKVFNKSAISREDLVQTFATMFLPKQPARQEAPVTTVAEQQSPEAPCEPVLPGMIEQIVAGVREQSEVLASDTAERTANGTELLSRVCSLVSCAKVAGLSNLARQARALENLLTQLKKRGYKDVNLSTVTRAVDVMSQMSFEATGKEQPLPRFSAVVVDEASASNRALKEALLKVGFEPFCFEEPARAREHLTTHRTDLVIANVLLPEAHSLATTDIKVLPLHGTTRVIFGPESTVTRAQGEDLPTSAARLDREPLLLAELIVRALNEVQSESVAKSTRSTVKRGPEEQRNLPSDLLIEDGFDLFGKSARKEDVSTFQSSVQDEPESIDTSAQTIRWSEASPSLETEAQENVLQFTSSSQPEPPTNQLFTADDIPDQVIFRVKPGAAETDHEAEVVNRLPDASPVDASQVDEKPLEAPPPSVLQTEPPVSSAAEPTLEDHTAVAEWLVAAATEGGQSIIAKQSSSAPFEVNETVPVQEPIEAASNHQQNMNNQLQAAPEEYAQQVENSLPGAATGQSNDQQEDLTARAYEAEMALYRAETELEAKNQTIAALQKQLAEASVGSSLSTVGLPANHSAEQQAQARCAELEQELASLRQAFESFDGSFGQQQQAADETGKKLQEFEQRLTEKAGELEKVQAQQRQNEAELRQQLDEANAARKQSDDARQQTQTRCGELEQELGSLRQAREDLAGKLAQEQKTSADASAKLKQLQTQATAGENTPSAQASELEHQVRQGVAALARATAELAKEKGERQRSQQRVAELSGRLQTLHEDFGRTLQMQRENLERIHALEEEQRQTSQELEKRTADVEQHQAELQLAEAQLQKAKESNVQLRKDLSFFEETNKKFGGSRQELQARLEASLNAARDSEARLQKEIIERQRLAMNLEAAQRDIQDQTRRREILEQELKAAREALQERDATLQKEAAERQKLNEEQNSVRRDLWDGSERDLQFSKLQTTLELEQIERQRQESQLARMRQSARDAAQAARALRATLRRQVREPIDNLVQSASALLELEMAEEQKKLAEAILQDVLLAQTRLREPDVTRGNESIDGNTSQTPILS